VHPRAAGAPAAFSEGTFGPVRAVRRLLLAHQSGSTIFDEGLWGCEGFVASERYEPFMIMTASRGAGAYEVCGAAGVRREGHGTARLALLAARRTSWAILASSAAVSSVSA
jgi:hypothetical protein